MQTIDKILEKFGIYDIFVILLSGMIMLSIFIVVLKQTDILIVINDDNFPDKILLFFLCSYLLGLVIQECGSIIDKYILFPDNTILKLALWTKSDNRNDFISKSFKFYSKFLFKRIISSHIYLTKTERNGILDKLKNDNIIDFDTKKISWMNNSENVNSIYNYCKSTLQCESSSIHIDKEQAISSSCRSLFVFFLFLVVFAVIWHSHFQSISFLILLIISSFFFTILFFIKFIRHAKMRYVYIFRWFYYNKVISEGE